MFQKERENIDKTHKRRNKVIATKIGFGSRLYKGKVLAPLTSIVLDGNRLVYVCLSVFKEIANFYNRRRKRVFIFRFLNSPETSRLVPTYSLAQWESQSSVVPLENVQVGWVVFRRMMR